MLNSTSVSEIHLLQTQLLSQKCPSVSVRKLIEGAEEMAQPFRALTALAENRGVVPSTLGAVYN